MEYRTRLDGSRYLMRLKKKWTAGDVATEGQEQIPAAPVKGLCELDVK